MSWNRCGTSQNGWGLWKPTNSAQGLLRSPFTVRIVRTAASASQRSVQFSSGRFSQLGLNIFGLICLQAFDVKMTRNDLKMTHVDDNMTQNGGYLLCSPSRIPPIAICESTWKYEKLHASAAHVVTAIGLSPSAVMSAGVVEVNSVVHDRQSGAWPSAG